MYIHVGIHLLEEDKGLPYKHVGSGPVHGSSWANSKTIDTIYLLIIIWFFYFRCNNCKKQTDRRKKIHVNENQRMIHHLTNWEIGEMEPISSFHRTILSLFLCLIFLPAFCWCQIYVKDRLWHIQAVIDFPNTNQDFSYLFESWTGGGPSPQCWSLVLIEGL